MHHFGEPLVTTPSDFGIRCDPPTHPELLDYLARASRRRLVAQGAASPADRALSTYRQASIDRPECRAADPENRLLWRMNRRRLDLEAMRDTLLAVAGQLDTHHGRPAGGLDCAPTTPRRRAVYGFIDRQDLPGMLPRLRHRQPRPKLRPRRSRRPSPSRPCS